MGSISIIIPVLSSPAALARTLASLQANELLPGDEIVIANDGGDPRCRQVAADFAFASLNILDIKVSRGSYHARNEALSQALNELILFADAGLLFPADTLKKMRDLLQRCDYVAGNVKVERSETESLAEKFYRLSAYDMETLFKRYHAGGAGFLGVRRSVIRQLGAFDESFYSGADNEFGKRVHKAGFIQHFEKDLIALHATRSWNSQFKVRLRILKGHQLLAERYPDDYKNLRIGFWTFLLFPFRALRSIAGAVVNRKELFNNEFNLREALIASVIHHYLVFRAMFLILIFPKKNFNLR